MVPNVGWRPLRFGLNIATAPATTQASPTSTCKLTTTRKTREVDSIGIPNRSDELIKDYSNTLCVLAPDHFRYERQKSGHQCNSHDVVKSVRPPCKCAKSEQSDSSGAKEERWPGDIAMQPMATSRIHDTTDPHPSECDHPDKSGCARKQGDEVRRESHA